ncbi:hypothetical protein DENIS_0343 [Desulfonema ishimotonii]|uniref:DUF2750 domain-containing protein n=1 Tax=Desulfonema ishimotonii TaxID=45657 RepID=A0A401FR21_9BACT|nr:DUF2750 domain-containing protein [Desulfonema ishimotonii]GBC59404.1 hypothetical protein DENIS_0343 [Desulfonema ishimotonii]
MHQKKIENLLKMSGKERFLYFVRKVADFEEVWGLFADGWAMTADNEGRKAIPFWPEKDFSNLCAEGAWKNYNSKQIKLDKFMSKWLPGMEKDGVLVAIFPTPKNKGVIIQPKELSASLEEEIEQYE